MADASARCEVDMLGLNKRGGGLFIWGYTEGVRSHQMKRGGSGIKLTASDLTKPKPACRPAGLLRDASSLILNCNWMWKLAC